MRELVRRGALPVLLLAALTVVAAGLLTQPQREVDRTYELQQRLRCPTCQGVSVAESPSETAAAIRQQVEQQVAAGRSDEEVLGHFSARYGDWVVLDPPMRGTTLLVWLLPLAAGGVALAILVALPRRETSPPLPEEERARVRRELAALPPTSVADEQP